MHVWASATHEDTSGCPNVERHYNEMHEKHVYSAVSSNLQYSKTDRRKPDAASHAWRWRSFYQENSEQVKWFCNRVLEVTTRTQRYFQYPRKAGTLEDASKHFHQTSFLDAPYFRSVCSSVLALSAAAFSADLGLAPFFKMLLTASVSAVSIAESQSGGVACPYLFRISTA